MVDWQVAVPIITSIIAGGALIFAAKVGRDNKPVRDILKKTKINGQGSLVEALGVLTRQRQYDAVYYSQQVKELRAEVHAKDRKIGEQGDLIEDLYNEISELKRRLREAGIDHE